MPTPKPKSKPLTKIELDIIFSGGCEVPGCMREHGHEALVIQPRCHFSAGVEVFYRPGSGVLNIICKECKNAVADIAVADPGSRRKE